MNIKRKRHDGNPRDYFFLFIAMKEIKTCLCAYVCACVRARVKDGIFLRAATEPDKMRKLLIPLGNNDVTLFKKVAKWCNR